MPIRVRAHVVDIRTDAPSPSDHFFVDTNVWYWLAYLGASRNPVAPPVAYQTTEYPAYIKSALVSKAKLYCCPLTLAELAHNIEQCEREIYEDRANRKIPTKAFRHDYPAQRTRIVEEIDDAWGQVTQMSRPLEIVMDEATSQSCMNKLRHEELDGYDRFMVEVLSCHGITQIITDDGDYGTIAGVTIFTSNRTLINAASAARRLITR